MGLIDVELLDLLIRLDDWFEKKRALQLIETMHGDALSLLYSETAKRRSAPADGNSSNAQAALSD
ncbi:unnamed protein product, partial [Gongylonema pulchrum]|uniref:PABC domain-containing protein n=1 Tax=Gongylonema pulchrum TaxID=637853 RepID=A0A183DI58_9BILA